MGFPEEFSTEVARVLDRKKPGYYPREESITEKFVDMICLYYEKRIQLIPPNEPRTGADIRLHFISGKLDSRISFSIQCKKLYKNNKCVMKSNYKEIPHRVGGMGDYQIDLLIDHSLSNNSYPLYMFYNPRSECVRASKLDNPIILQGCMISRANAVKQAITLSEPWDTSVSALSHTFLSLEILLGKRPADLIEGFERGVFQRATMFAGQANESWDPNLVAMRFMSAPYFHGSPMEMLRPVAIDTQFINFFRLLNNGFPTPCYELFFFENLRPKYILPYRHPSWKTLEEKFGIFPALEQAIEDSE